jgi:type I restriction enzyme S subunit
MLPEFLEILLNDPVRLVEIDGLKTGTSESGMNLTQTKVRELLVPAPPLDEQVVVIKRVQELMQLADTVDERVRTATARVVRSSQAVLARAFRGELVSL